MSLDLSVFRLFNSLLGVSGFLDGAVIFFGNYFSYFLIFFVFWFIFQLKGLKNKIFALIFFALAALIARGVITNIIHFFYNRPRPFKVLDFTPLFYNSNPSFPSGHAVLLFTFGFVIFYFSRSLGWWFLGFSFLNSVARVIAGVHWPSDIIGGIVIAFLSFLITLKLLKKYQPENFSNQDSFKEVQI